MKRYLELLGLIREDSYVTTSHLAQALGVSSRTVRSYIAQLNRELGAWGAGVIAMPRKGVRLVVSDRERYSSYHPAHEQSDLTRDERIRQIAEYLLTVDKPVLLDDLAEMLHFSRSTLKRDMREVRQLLAKFELKVDNRAHRGMRVEGSEEGIRNGLAHLKRAAGVAVGTAEGDELAALREIVTRQVADGRFRISDLAVENLAVHLYIAIKRVRTGNQIELDPRVISELAGEAKGVSMDVATGILEEVELAYDVRFPRSEAYNFLARLSGKQIVSLDDATTNTVVAEENTRLVFDMLERVRESYQIDLRYDIELVTALAMHLAPLRTRMKYGLPSVNPLLDEIRHGYVLAFSMATVACSVLTGELGYDVPADEVAYVAMYLSVALDRHRDKADEKDNVLIVCGSGRAFSEMLAHRIRDMFGRYLNIVGTTSAHDIGQVDFADIDYVFSTVAVNYPVPVPIVEVTTFLADRDVSNIARTLSEKRMNRLATELIHSELVFWKDLADREEVIAFLCHEMAARAELPDDFEVLVLEREQAGATAFGNLVAIAHPIRAVGTEDVLALAILKHPIDWGGEEVQLVFLLSIGQKKSRGLANFYRMMNGLVGNRRYVERLVASTSVEEVKRTLRLVAEASAQERQ
ncbi:BglG family transcription antiterminator [Actinomyces qiguomingii]|uniref:BglG family transcription antiterminator n=1 Tax=Actinomyces qiguomingii TaxID=2057800 RepID=UPI000FFE4EDD|nr:BglG family transcription antiterminator [Actinomyces qiguomingii]